MALVESVGVRFDPAKAVDIGSPHLEIAAAVLGLGLTIAVEIVIRAELASGQLREVPFEGLPEAQYLLSLSRGPRRAVIIAAVNWVRTLV